MENPRRCLSNLILIALWFVDLKKKVYLCPLVENLLIKKFKQLTVMYAIVDIAGQQMKVKENQKLFVNRLANEEGSVVEFEKVLLKDLDGTVQVGTPLLEGAKITAKVLSHLKGDKVIIFKKKRRKGYRKTNGFRASLTEIQIEKIA